MKNFTLITGATSGIGYEFARLFAMDGNNLILVARDYQKLNEMKKAFEKEFKIDIYILNKDLKEESSVAEIYDFTKQNDLFVENLINNAGFGSFGYFKDVERDWDAYMIKVNILALTNLAKYFLPHMVEKNTGGILNVASTAAFSGGPVMSVYYASKAYVLSLSEALWQELKETNVRVSALCPGPVDTAFQKVAKVKKGSLAKGYMMTPELVSKIGYIGFKKGKRVIIPGFKNKILIQSLRFLPRRFILNIIKRVNNG